MRKKIFIIPIAMVTLLAFGTVSSAHAFVDLFSLTVVLGAGFLTSVLAADEIEHTKAELAQKEAEKQAVGKKAQKFKHISGLEVPVAAEAN